jgi:Tfp pilus assembly protein PilE
MKGFCLKIWQNRAKISKEQGFTFLEFFLFVIIMGIIMTIALYYYADLPQDAARSAVLNDLDTLKTAVKIFYFQQKRFPEDLDELVKRGYIRQNPDDKFLPNRNLKYLSIRTDNYFKVWSRGPNGLDEGGLSNAPHDDLKVLIFGP